MLLGLTGAWNVAYIIRIARRTRRLTAYRAQTGDWLWHAVLPLAAYVAIIAAAIRLPADPVDALFAVAGATILLIFIGIHNAWDVVTYLAVRMPDRGEDDDPARDG